MDFNKIFNNANKIKIQQKENFQSKLYKKQNKSINNVWFRSQVPAHVVLKNHQVSTWFYSTVRDTFVRQQLELICFSRMITCCTGLPRLHLTKKVFFGDANDPPPGSRWFEISFNRPNLQNMGFKEHILYI